MSEENKLNVSPELVNLKDVAPATMQDLTKAESHYRRGFQQGYEAARIAIADGRTAHDLEDHIDGPLFDWRYSNDGQRTPPPILGEKEDDPSVS